MQLPRDREIDFKRYGLYTCGVLCGYLMIFIVGPFFFFMGVILVITGALFGLEQILSGGWIFMIIGITIFILGIIIPKVCGAVLSRMIVRDVTDIVKENEPALNEIVAAAWAEGVNNQIQHQNNLRQNQLQFPGFSSYPLNGSNIGGAMTTQWLSEPGPNPTMQRPARFPQPPAYPGHQQQQSTPPPPPPPYPGRQQQQSTPPPPPPPYQDTRINITAQHDKAD